MNCAKEDMICDYCGDTIDCGGLFKQDTNEATCHAGGAGACIARQLRKMRLLSEAAAAPPLTCPASGQSSLGCSGESGSAFSDCPFCKAPRRIVYVNNDRQRSVFVLHPYEPVK